MAKMNTGLRRRIQVVHPNLFTFLGNALLVPTVTTELLRRAKERVNLPNDARIKACSLQRFDNGGYTRIQFLCAVSHSLGARVPCDVMNQSDSDDDDDVPTASGNGNGGPSAAVQPPDLCEVCVVEERDARHAQVPCGHQRFCASCAARVEAEAHGCPLVALLSPWCCSVLHSVATYSPSYFGEHTYNVAYIRNVQHFRRFLFQYSGRFSELLCYISLLNALVNCMLCDMNSNSIALTSHRLVARVFTVLYVP